MQIVIVRTCDTSRGRIVCEVAGGTEDQGPFEFSALEAENLIASGHARVPPPAPAVDPHPTPAPAQSSVEAPQPDPAPPAPELVTTET